MKNIILLALILLYAGTLKAQDKKVAMLETIAATEGISTMVKNMVRGELTKSISLEKGYIAFTRSDVDKMASEMKFQSSGMVSDEQRSQIGLMSGADYICISKVSKDGESYYIEAHLVAVKSGAILNPATKFISGGGISAVNKGSRIVGRELIYGPGSGSEIKQSAEEIEQERIDNERLALAKRRKEEDEKAKQALAEKCKMPKVFRVKDVLFNIVDCKRQGSDIVIIGALQADITTEVDLFGRWGIHIQSKIYTDVGGIHNVSAMTFGDKKDTSHNNSDICLAQDAPGGIPMQFTFTFKDIPSSVTSIKLFSMAFAMESKSVAYTRLVEEIKDILITN